MTDLVPYIPILTTILSAAFGWVVLRRYYEKRRVGVAAPHLLWWGIGIVLFGVGTCTEGLTAVIGWHAPVFRAWYISGALLGGAPLAQGTVYLLLDRRTADRLTIALLAYVAAASVLVLLTPLDTTVVDDDVLNGDVIEWTWVRILSPVVNTYAVIFLIGGAIVSAFRYRAEGLMRPAYANALIALGAILPGIGGSFSRAGHTEVLYVGEFIGIILIYLGFRLSTRPRPVVADAAGGSTLPSAGAAR